MNFFIIKFSRHFLLCTSYAFDFFYLHIMYMCVHSIISFLIDLSFSTFSLCLCSSLLLFLFEHIIIIFQMTFLIIKVVDSFYVTFLYLPLIYE
jgi:hypothetical protein